jgi:hypothetical protein
MTAPLGGPVVPLVKITTPGAFSSNGRSDEIKMSAASSVGVYVQGPMGMPRKCSLLVVAIRFSKSQHFFRSKELTNTKADLDFSTKYAASSTGKAGVIGTAAAPNASTASIATVYS